MVEEDERTNSTEVEPMNADVIAVVVCNDSGKGSQVRKMLIRDSLLLLVGNMFLFRRTKKRRRSHLFEEQ